MSYMNDNDIDELIKRASDKYPLRTDSADWGKLSASLEKDPSLILSPVSVYGEKGRRKRFFWLFFLLPVAGLLGYLGYYVCQPAGHSPAVVTSPAATVATTTSSPTTTSSATTVSSSSSAATTSLDKTS